jgi:hypothetical protein
MNSRRFMPARDRTTDSLDYLGTRQQGDWHLDAYFLGGLEIGR